MTTPRPTSNNKEIVTLRDYFESHLEALNKSISKSEDVMNVRLEGMNEFREQINQERGQYVLRGEHNLLHRVVEKDIADLKESRAELRGKASSASVIGVSIISVVSLLIGVASFIAALMK